MKPFFNLGCALVAWNELCRVARRRTGGAARAAAPGFHQGRHSRQFVYAGSPQLLHAYQGLLLEPLWLLDTRRDGRWQLVSTALGHSLNLRLQALLRAWLPALPQAAEAGPGIARLRLVLPVPGIEPSPSPGRPINSQSPLVQGLAAYLEQVASVVQLEDSVDGRLLGGGVNLQSPAAGQEHDRGDDWQDLLGCDWQQLLQFKPAERAAG
ncbi:hypothetical protein [Chromobacterium phragmitis]|uniref:hypothetical protein n=1 Tax=Chromobacterium phragmitis TaxID=2202141 RepID=UPI0011AE86E0|nr:hypothetical protein [Chromobacterium phragmitis]